MPHVIYGEDTEATTDSTFARRQVSGEVAMAQAMVRRLTTTRGALAPLGMPDYGYNLRRFLKGIVPPISTVNGAVENELLKDERILDVTVEASHNELDETFTVKAVGLGDLGPFDLTLVISEVTVQILREGST